VTHKYDNEKRSADINFRWPFLIPLFISNTSAEVTPVIVIGGNTLGEGIPGPITRLIREKFDAEIRAYNS